MNPSDLNYSEEHEWVRVESDSVVQIGITEFAAESLGDVVFVDLPEPGAEFSQFDAIGEIESVKAVSDLFTPIGGIVKEVNPDVIDNPEIVNQDPFGNGWLVKLQIADDSGLDQLMSSDQYQAFLESQA
ncbi:MAG: glycine cleavage system protein GcvH [Chloroflexota bacterium]|nr:glycine cleavage system protein GcvH [Chloroflexota bacterium]